MPCRPHHASRHAPGIILLGAISLLPGSAAAICDPDGAAALCSPAVIGAGPSISQSDIDTNAAILTTGHWVIDGTTTITLPAGGDYTPGLNPGLGQPAIFVTDSASLVIDGAGATGVDLHADVFVCGGGSLRITDSEVRFDQPQPQLWAQGTSQVLLQGAALRATSTGTLYLVMVDQATLAATPTLEPSIATPSTLLELVLGESSAANIQGAAFTAEIEVDPAASLTAADSDYFSVRLEVCEGDTLDLANVPDACDIDTSCFTASHPQTTFAHAATHTLDISSSRVFGWTVSTQPGSSSALSNVGIDANMAVDVAGDLGTVSLGFPAGGTPTGLTDRTIELDTVDLYGWQLVPSGTSDVTVEADSELARLECIGDAVCSVDSTTFVDNAPVIARDQARIELGASTLGGTVLSDGAAIELADDTAAGALTVAAPTWLADTSYPSDDILSGGALYEVTLGAPAKGASIDVGETVSIQGTVAAQDDAGEVTPFPTAVLELYDPEAGTTQTLASLTAAAAGATLLDWDTTDLTPGTYELRLRFEDATFAVSRRTITLLGDVGTTGGSSSGGESSGGADSGSSSSTSSGESSTTGGDSTSSDPTNTSSSGGDSGDTDAAPSESSTGGGCRTTGDTAPPWLLLGVLFPLLRRRPTR